MHLLKFIGIILVILSSTLIGFFKSRLLVLKSKKLSLFLDGLNTLYEYIKQEGCELSVAIANSFFKCDFLKFEENQALLCGGDFKDCEKKEIKEFFSLLGSSGKQTECDRINGFKLKIKKMCDDAQNDAAQKCKIYQTFGICIGLAIGILLI